MNSVGADDRAITSVTMNEVPMLRIKLDHSLTITPKHFILVNG